MAVVFLISPASCAGSRARTLLASKSSALKQDLEHDGVPLGQLFTYLSSLYFRGKLAYATCFGAPPAGWPPGVVIAPGRGLVSPEARIRFDDFRAMAGVPVDPAEPRYREPLVRDARALERALPPRGLAVLLGSVATDKYVTPLLEVFAERLHFPATFVGRGDMSRGGLLLRAAAAGTPLEYVPVQGAVRHGSRPPRLDRLRRTPTGNALRPALIETHRARAEPRDQ
ncbi:MAG TPA: hypothetical protein VLV45_05270 [Gemmatimonadales bacterium]|nr:hypothetical protein [Gemmatimonadales bacterium]